MRKTLSFLRRAIDDYNMIESGDKIAVGVSGGKDSLLLLAGLAGLKKFYPLPFDLVAITIDMGFEGGDFSPIADYCRELGIEYIIKKTDIGAIIFDHRKEKNPCSLCAKMRRGSLNDTAKESGCNKVALGHNFDDVVETVFMNLCFEGRFGCFAPVTYLSRVDLTVIRPLIYMEEKTVKSTANRNNLPIVESLCPANGNTERENVKNQLHAFKKDIPKLKERLFSALCKSELNGWKQIH